MTQAHRNLYHLSFLRFSNPQIRIKNGRKQESGSGDKCGNQKQYIGLLVPGQVGPDELASAIGGLRVLLVIVHRLFPRRVEA